MRRIGYFTDWSIYRPTFTSLNDIIAKGEYTHIIYAFAIPDPADGIKFADDYAAFDKGLIEDLLLLKEQINFQLGVSIGGWNHKDSFKKLSKRFSSQVANFCAKHGFDFVDIDWEFESDSEATKWSRNIHELVKSLSDCGLRLTLAIQCNMMILQALRIQEIQNYIELFIVMGYDFSGPWSPLTNHNCNLHGSSHSISAVVDELCTLIAKCKICLAVTGAAKVFHQASGFLKPFSSCETLMARDINARSHEFKWDPSCEASWVQKGDQVISLETQQSLESKLRYIWSRNLAGIAVWDIESFTLFNNNQ